MNLKKVLLGLAALVVAFLVFGAIMANTPEGKEKQRARDVIEQCHREEKAWTGTASAKSIITGACKKLEDDYRAKFGRNP